MYKNNSLMEIIWHLHDIKFHANTSWVGLTHRDVYLDCFIKRAADLMEFYGNFEMHLGLCMTVRRCNLVPYLLDF